MTTLLVLRHAKSPHAEGVVDHDRPILPEAREQIASLARQLAAEGLVPGVVLSSDAVRAAATAHAYAKAVSAGAPVLLPELYTPGEPADLLSAIQTYGGEARVLLLVGHNPGLEDFCNRLTSRPLLHRLGTGALAVFTVDLQAWSDLLFGTARRIRLVESH